MAAKPGFFDYVTAAFNARPFGMFVAPNWIGLGAFGCSARQPRLLGARRRPRARLPAHARDQPALPARRSRAAAVAARAEWNSRINALLWDGSMPDDRRIYDALAERCRSIIDLQMHGAAETPHGIESQADSLGRLSWMFLRLLVARRTIDQVVGDRRRRRLAERGCRRWSGSSATSGADRGAAPQPRRSARDPHASGLAAHRTERAQARPTSTPSSSASSSRSS